MITPRSFPKIRELPQLIDASDWVWQKPSLHDDKARIKAEWWIGTDSDGTKWLLKMTGGFYAYREHVFASLAQRIGISCQSSAYVLIGSESAEPRSQTEFSEPFQLAIWLMDEHADKPCSLTCPWSIYSATCRNGDYLNIHQASTDGVSYFDDLMRGDVLGYLCGQFEPHDHFLTSQHEYVVIDNELMFAAERGVKRSLNGCRWLKFDAAGSLVTEVCRNFVQITDKELHEIAEIPKGYSISNGRNLYHDLRAAKAAASDYLK